MNEHDHDIERLFDRKSTIAEKDSLLNKIEKEGDPDKALLIEIKETIIRDQSINDLKKRLVKVTDAEASYKSWSLGNWKIAATISLLFLSFYVLFISIRSKSNEKVFNEYFKVYNGVAILRGERSTLIEGFQYYQANEFEKALTEFLRNSEEENSAVVKLLIANCYLKLDEAEKSLKWLESMEVHDSSLIVQSRDWYMALAQLKLNNINESEALLAKLVEMGSIYQESASNLIKEPSYNSNGSN